jgi:secondary thiamine-phosphate synthase enzyme
MGVPHFIEEHTRSTFKTTHHRVQLSSERRVQFIDITELVSETVRRAGIRDGILNVQTRHTTTAVVVNENEPGLLKDFEKRLEAWAPQGLTYQHNDLHARRFQKIAPDEKPNGDSHARALALGTSETLNVTRSRLELGEWQRLFLVELDGPRTRTLSLMVMGTESRP